jgi:hypothetical protein
MSSLTENESSENFVLLPILKTSTPAHSYITGIVGFRTWELQT